MQYRNFDGAPYDAIYDGNQRAYDSYYDRDEYSYKVHLKSFNRGPANGVAEYICEAQSYDRSDSFPRNYGRDFIEIKRAATASQEAPRKAKAFAAAGGFRGR